MEWSINPVAGEIEPGLLRFEVANGGSLVHQLLVVKTDLRPAELPLLNDAVDEGKVNVVAKLDGVTPASKAALTLELSPGKYVLLCNRLEQTGGAIIGHYRRGMYAGLLVTA